MLECRPCENLYDAAVKQNNYSVDEPHAQGGIIIIKFTLSNPATATSCERIVRVYIPEKHGLVNFMQLKPVLYQYFYEFGWQLPPHFIKNSGHCETSLMFSVCHHGRDVRPYAAYNKNEMPKRACV